MDVRRLKLLEGLRSYFLCGARSELMKKSYGLPDFTNQTTQRLKIIIYADFQKEQINKLPLPGCYHGHDNGQ